MNELSKLLTFKRELPRHLRELGILLGRPVHLDDLMSIEETTAVRSKANEITREPIARFDVAFEEKQTPRFAAFVQRLVQANSSDVYLWTPASNECGVLRPLPIGLIDVAFPFDVNPEGIIAILASDLQDQLLLDYSTGNNGEQLLEVEVSGEHWAPITY